MNDVNDLPELQDKLVAETKNEASLSEFCKVWPSEDVTKEVVDKQTPDAVTEKFNEYYACAVLNGWPGSAHQQIG